MPELLRPVGVAPESSRYHSNDDWDGAGLVVDDYLFEGGENSWFYIVKLNRGYGADGKVTVNPQVVFKTPGWDQELWNTISDHQFSNEFPLEALNGERDSDQRD